VSLQIEEGTSKAVVLYQEVDKVREELVTKFRKILRTD